MAVTGDYLAVMVRAISLPYLRAYESCVLQEVLPAFANLEGRADELANTEFERLGAEPVGEEYDGDMGALAERAQGKSQAFYDTMVALRQTTVNLFAAGLFHLLEQHLANLCHDGAFRVVPPNGTKLAVVARWYQRHFDLNLQALPSWSAIDELRLVANAVKHGEGGSVADLRGRRPEFFQHPVSRELWPTGPIVHRPVRLPLAGDDLYITVDVFREYSQAATRFVSEIADHLEDHGREYYPRGG